MWLFDHAVNRTRAAQGALRISGLWLWGGGGGLSSLPPVTGWTAGDDPFFAAFQRTDSAADDAGNSGVIVIDDEPGTEAWREAESRWLAPAFEQLRSGRLARVELSAGDRRYRVGRRLELAAAAAAPAMVGVFRLSTEIRRRPSAPAHRFTEAVHPVLRRVYAARGLNCDEDLDLSLDRLLPVGSLDGVDAATELLAAHRAAGRVLVIGDFDADGATSTALVVRALRAMHFAHVDFLVPNRFRFGYGLTPEIVALAATRTPTLIVTVDNGVSSVAGVEAARSLGIPVLVTDHHLPGAVLPRADVIVNPNLAHSQFGSFALAGVGVAFYVVAALARRLGAEDFRAAELLDLAALGTVADVVPLDRNNRILIAQGLRRIRAGRCVPGIRALLESAGRGFEQTTAGRSRICRGRRGSTRREGSPT